MQDDIASGKIACKHVYTCLLYLVFYSFSCLVFVTLCPGSKFRVQVKASEKMNINGFCDLQVTEDVISLYSVQTGKEISMLVCVIDVQLLATLFLSV